MNNIKQKGYAILVTIVVVSIITLIAIGLSRSTYKQLILSSLAKDSQTSFYQADTASECALYFDRVLITDPATISFPTTFSCGMDLEGSSSSIEMKVSIPDSSGSYEINPPDSILNSDNQPCFRIEVIKETGATSGVATTTIKAKGYNICNELNIRTVERTISISY